MAVENCTISTQSITALGGSTLVAGTKTLIITPDAGFEVSAAQCSVGNAMETFNGSNTWNTVGANVTTGITQVQFADVGDGTVEAIVTHGAISISNNTTDFLVDIDVSAAVPPSFTCVLIEVRHNINSGDGTIMSTSQFSNIDSITEVEVIDTPALHQITSSGEVNSTAGTITQIAKARITAVAGVFFGVNDDGFPSVSPNLSGMGGLQPNWSTAYTNLIHDGDFLTQFDVDVFYETPVNNPNGVESANDFCDLGHKISIRVKSSKIPTARTMSYSVDGFSAPSQLEYNSGAQDIKVFGVEGSRFNFFVQDEDGKFYNHSTGNFSHGRKAGGNGAAKGYFRIPRGGIFKTTLNYPRSSSASKSYSYFVEGVSTPAKVSVGTGNSIEASITSLSSSVPTEQNKTTVTQYARQRVQLKVTQSASAHTIPTAAATGVSLYGITNQVQKSIAPIEDSNIPYSGAKKSLTKVDFSLAIQTGASGGKTWRATGRALQTSTLRYVADANTVTIPRYYIENGAQTGSGDPDGATVTFSGTLYVEKFGEVVGDGVYCLEIYLDDFILLA